jgi:dipeptidyl aminopeptidase/acylaminoacyl peptidase
MTKRTPITQDFYQYKFVSTPDLCAQKDLFAYVIAYAEKGQDRYKQEIIVRDLDGGNTRKISAGGWEELNPRFSPDGNSLMFLSNASRENQVWIADLATGATRRLTNMRYGTSSPHWSPLGDKIAFLSPCPPDTGKDLLQTPASAEEKAKEASEKKRQPWVVTDFGYKSDPAMGFAKPEGSMHLWVMGINDEKALCLTDGDCSHVMPVWSPDGKTLLFASSRAREKKEFLGMDLFSVPAEGGEIKRLTDAMSIAYYPTPFIPRFTPDGKYIIAGGLVMTGEDLPPTWLFRIPAEGGEAVRIFPDDAPCDGATLFMYNGDGYGKKYETAQVSSDGKYVYFISGWHGCGNIYRVNLEGEPCVVEQVTKNEGYYDSMGAPANGKMICLRGDMQTCSEVWMLDETTHEETRLTENNPWMAEVLLSPMEGLWIDTLDGKSRVQGWVIKPQNAKAGEKYPAVLYIHGGPTPFYGYALSYEHQALAGQGIGVILVNPRGSTGYGVEHARTAQANDGTAYYDLLQFVEEAVKRFDWIDGNRLGVCGGSYGGYRTNWMAGHSKRFKAAASHRSIANDLIEYASSDMAGYASSKSHESFTDFMIDQLKSSPVTYADTIDIPFLILHSTGDMRCPVEHAHQLFTAIKDQHPNLPVRMVLFPKSNHNLTMSGLMYLRIIHYDENINWFKKYL